MSTITTRSGKGSPLTNNEVDANFTNLNTDKLESADLAGYATLSGATFTGEVEATGFNGDLTGAILFKGQAGEALTKGDPVYISGISGNKTVVSKADANDANKMPCFGIVDATVSANADCSVITFGTLQGLDTSSFSEGDELFVSDTGTLTTTAPTGESSQLQKIGKVTRSHASTGSIKVMGAGRTNAVPNLNDGQFFLGNGSNQAVSTDFTTSVLGEISAGTGIGISGSGVISNSAPDQTVSLTGAGTTTISGTYPNFTITGAGTTYTAGTGITLTGTEFSIGQSVATTDSPAFAGLTVDTTTLAVDSTNNRVGIGTASPSQKLTVGGTDARIYLTGANTDIDMDNSANGQLHLDGNAYGFGIALNADGAQLYTNAASRDLIFGVNETEVARLTPNNFTVTAATDPTITVKATGSGDADADIILDASDTGESGVVFNNSGVKKARIDWSNQNLQLNIATESGTNGTLDFQPNDVLAMRILADGKVGIGTGAPTYALSVKGLGSSTVPASFESSGSSSWLMLKDSGTTLGNVRVGSSSNALVQYAGGSERMRIDSSGKVGIGTASPSSTLTVSSASEGTLIELQTSGSHRGGIGVKGGDLYIGEAAVGLSFDVTGPDGIRPFSVSGQAYRDNGIDLGGASARFQDLYLVNDNIITSDRNEKQDIAELSDAEQRVAVACKGLLRKFRLKDSVAEKGDDARIHFGIIAQDLQDAFTAEGLDAGDYAMFISTTWTDEETNEEKTRMGVRYSELLAFIIAAL